MEVGGEVDSAVVLVVEERGPAAGPVDLAQDDPDRVAIGADVLHGLCRVAGEGAHCWIPVHVVAGRYDRPAGNRWLEAGTQA